MIKCIVDLPFKYLGYVYFRYCKKDDLPSLWNYVYVSAGNIYLKSKIFEVIYSPNVCVNDTLIYEYTWTKEKTMLGTKTLICTSATVLFFATWLIMLCAGYLLMCVEFFHELDLKSPIIYNTSYILYALSRLFKLMSIS